MCRSRKSLRVVEPRPANSQSTPKSSGSNSGSTRFNSDWSQNNSRSNWSLSSTASTHLALSQIKESLSNPNLYQFSEIQSATQNLTLLSKSTSFPCILRAQNAVVYQRNLRHLISPSELHRRLTIVSKSHHTSLISLLGVSTSDHYLYTVYQQVPGPTLSQTLRNPRNPSFTPLSTWLSRMRVLSDISDGLDYIHGCLSIVHGYLDSSAIIVTDSANARIMHFGTSTLCGEIEGSGRKIRIEGTKGYMAPEFQTTGIPTQKSDVYAFGVILLEILSGDEAVRYNVDVESGAYQRETVMDVAKACFERGGVRMWIDRRLRDSFPVSVAEELGRVGLECTDIEPARRPNMGRVSGMISRLYLESESWAEKLGVVNEFSVSFAPR